MHCVHTDKIEINPLSPLSTLPYLTLPYLTLPSSPSSPLPHSPSPPSPTSPFPPHPLPLTSPLTPPFPTSPPQVTDLSTDMTDGLVLITLMEQLRGKKIQTRLEPGREEEGRRRVYVGKEGACGEGRCTWGRKMHMGKEDVREGRKRVASVYIGSQSHF